MNVLVTGGAGYIGSHAVKHLREQGHHVVVLDNLHRGHRAALDAIEQASGKHVPFEELDLRHTEAVTSALVHHKIDCVMHFAALAYVGESVTEPLTYYDNNTAGTLSLLQAMHDAGVRRLVFSSTCATYGEPASMPIVETMPQSPINPYGWSKLFVERILIDYANANKDFAFAALRYFNVAGSAADGTIGEDHEPETHLIPIILEVALGQREHVTIFGEDYDTPDGTCIRDYIHVEDLVAAHSMVMQKLNPADQRFYNLGIGQGYSVKQIVDAAREVTGRDIPAQMGPRRPGDPPSLYANADKLRTEVGWTPSYTDIHRVIETAWRWYRNHPDGYAQP
ncbi:UDP-glucose 4-epimerase GalE [Phycisphaerales bacterium AB-hyl4]|uniref:UDP-glucose 4-epimerase n=1 Tax=Natronomicrosphaera hydrolytica TaxID=3242702 RepID=A0ABV4U1Y6_9BACT